MKTIRIFLFVLSLFAPGLAQAYRVQELVDYPAIAAVAGSGKALPADQVRQTIRSALQKNGWTTVQSADGKLHASLSWNGDKHTITVEITPLAEGYSLLYKSSINMNYEIVEGRTLIHPRYNKFVRILNKAIRAEFQNL